MSIRNIRTKRWRLLLAIAAVVLVVAVVLHFRTPPTPDLPATIGEMALVHQLQGERANEILNRMHEKEVTPATNMIGMYAGGLRSTVVYLSVYNSEHDARSAYETMAHRIEEGNPVFSEYRPLRIGDREASFCIGQGQHHYFFVHDLALYWLAADSSSAVRAVEELIETL